MGRGARTYRRASVATVVTGLALIAGSVASAEAARAPSSGEKIAIQRVAMEACAAGPGNCRFVKARVSTRNARFAWATVVGEGFSGVLLKRPTTGSRRFHVIGWQGGGISECAYWRERAPRSVLRDLRISGLVDASSGAVRNCGR